MRGLFGGLLLGVGILIMTCSGLCSLVVVVMGFADAMRDPSIIMLPLLVGGIPFAIGFGLFWGGRVLLRQAGSDPEP
ncbi:MAG TPA: hypothetical protein VF485_08285 [Sphingomonas sp.]